MEIDSQHCENFFQNSDMIIAHIPHGGIWGPKNLGSEKERWEGEREGREECAFKEFESDSSSELLRVASVTQ